MLEKHLKQTVKSVMLPYLIEKGILPPVNERETIFSKNFQSEKNNWIMRGKSCAIKLLRMISNCLDLRGKC